MNRLLNSGVIPLTNEERIFPRKLVFPDGMPVKYDDILGGYWTHTLILPLRNEDRVDPVAGPNPSRGA